MAINAAIATIYEQVERLDDSSLDAAIAYIMSVRIRRDYPEISTNEAALIQKINKGLGKVQAHRFELLRQKHENNTISDAERKELSRLLDRVENLNTNRLKHLSALALLRNVSVRELMQKMGIVPNLSHIR
jgi:hypothetical protein